MKAPARVSFERYPNKKPPLRIAVGDIIRCPKFNQCFVPVKIDSKALKAGEDPSRGSSFFLVENIKLVEHSEPLDMVAGEHRLCRDVTCARLTDDFLLVENPERIIFHMDDPWLVDALRIEEKELEFVGYCEFPIKWNDS